MTTVEIQTTISGGLPVLARGTIGRAEPDVGIMTDYVDDYSLLWLGGQICSVDLSYHDNERIMNELIRDARRQDTMAGMG